jgi:serine/threonine-protein kinase
MAPEQLGGSDPIDRRADVFAVGVMLWEALAGARMWGKRPELEILRALVDKKIPPLPESAMSQPAELREMVARATSADPEKRYATANEFRELIEQYLVRTGPFRSVTDLGLRLQEAFADDRDKLRRIVEDNTSALAETVGEVPKLELRRAQNVAPTAPTSRAAAPETVAKPPPQTSQPNIASESSQPTVAADARSSGRLASAAASGAYAAAPHRTKPSRMPWVFAMLGLALAGAAIWYATNPKHDGVAVTPIEPTASPSTIGSSTAATTSDGAEWVDVTITIAPAYAKVLVDGQPAPTNPLKMHERKGVHHNINVQAPGYLPVTKEVAFDTNLYLPIALELVPEGGLVVTGSLHKPAASASASASPPASAAPAPLHKLNLPRDVPGPR